VLPRTQWARRHPTAQAALAGLANLRASEDPQDQELFAVVEALTAAARGQPDTATTTDLLALRDRHHPGDLAPMQRAERDLARARLTTADGDQAAGAAFAAAITGLRQHSTPYYLAHGLLDHAAHPLRTGEDEAAQAAVGEAGSIAQRLGCQPLGDRADTIQPNRPRTAVGRRYMEPARRASQRYGLTHCHPGQSAVPTSIIQ
jgi:hypothetical protein